MSNPKGGKKKKPHPSSDSDEGAGSFEYCFAFPGGESPRPNLEKGEKASRDDDLSCYSDKYNARLLDWGGGWDGEAEESGVESITEGQTFSSLEEKEEFNKYLEELLEKEDFEQLKKQEEEIQKLKEEIKKYRKDDGGEEEVVLKPMSPKKKSNTGERIKHKEKEVEAAPKKKRSSSQRERKNRASSKVSQPAKKEVQELSAKEQALLEYKKAIAAKYARIRTDVKDHRSKMILDYYSDRLSRRLATNSEHGDTSPDKSPEVPPLKLSRIGGGLEKASSADSVLGNTSMRRSKLAEMKKHSQEGLDALDPSAGSETMTRTLPISFQEKKEEEKRYCVVIGDRFCGKTSLLEAVCVPRAVREKYDKDLRKSMKSSWFKRGNSLKKSNNPKRKDYTIRFEDTNGKMRTLVFFDISENGPDAEAKKAVAMEKADICLICYPVDDDSALDRLQERWIPEIQEVEPPLPIVLVGTRADMRMNGVEKLSREKSKGASKEEPIEGDEDEFKGLLLSKQLRLNGYVECSILFRKTLDRFLSYVSSVIAENEAEMARKGA